MQAFLHEFTIFLVIVKPFQSLHSTSSRAVLFSSFHAMTSSVIYYSTHVRQNEIYLLNNIYSDNSQTYIQQNER